MALYGIMIFFHVKDKSYIFYALHLLSNAGYAIFCWGRVDAEVQAIIPSTGHWFYAMVLFSTVGMIVYMYFLKSFLNLRKNLPKWNLIFNLNSYLGWFVIAFVVLNFLFNADPIRLNLVVATLYVLLSTILGIVFIWPMIKLKTKTNIYFKIGYCALTLCAMIAVIARIQEMTYFFVFIELGILAEVIFFSLGLAYQTQEREKTARRTLVELEASTNKRKLIQLEIERQHHINSIRRDFYTNLTHEFKTPLTVIQGAGDTLQSLTSDKEMKELGKIVSRNTSSILQMVNQMINVEHVNSEEFSFTYKKGEIIGFVTFLFKSFESLADSKGIILSIDDKCDSLEMLFDELCVQQIVYNLVSNAIKYTDRGGKVQLFLEIKEQSEKRFLKIEVSDNGRGIKAENIDRIFDKYYREKTTEDIEIDGAGIGLAYTKSILDKMGGKINVKSEEGSGSTFSAYVPILSEAELDSGALLHEPTLVVAEDRILSTLDTEKPILLIVEDNPDIISYLGYILRDHYQLMVSYNGQEGIQMATEHMPDIIISDVAMPESNGYELCKKLKSDIRTSHIPIILLTARAGGQAKLEALSKGADAFMPKPFNREELLIRLERLIELRGALQKKYTNEHLESGTKIESPNREDDFLSSLTSLIKDNLSNPDTTVHDFAKMMHISQVQFYRKIKALTNFTPSQFIRKVKLQNALPLMLNSDMTIAEIAFSSGFSDPNYFSRVFKSEYKITPKEYRVRKSQATV